MLFYFLRLLTRTYFFVCNKLFFRAIKLLTPNCSCHTNIVRKALLTVLLRQYYNKYVDQCEDEFTTYKNRYLKFKLHETYVHGFNKY